MTTMTLFQTDVQDTVVLQASKTKVFEALTHWSAFPAWNPYITRIDGKAEAGQNIIVLFSMGFGPRLPLSCKVEQVDNQKTWLAWTYEAPLPWLYTAQHSFAVQELQPGHCQLVQTESIKGLVACPLFWFFHRLLQKRFQVMHAALREQVKQRAA